MLHRCYTGLFLLKEDLGGMEGVSGRRRLEWVAEEQCNLQSCCTPVENIQFGNNSANPSNDLFPHFFSSLLLFPHGQFLGFVKAEVKPDKFPCSSIFTLVSQQYKLQKNWALKVWDMMEQWCKDAE